MIQANTPEPNNSHRRFSRSTAPANGRSNGIMSRKTTTPQVSSALRAAA